MDELNSALGDAFHELGIVTLDETTVEVATHPMPTRVRVDGIHVDIISYGPGLAPDGILEPIAGVTLDITGLREAAAGAEEIEIEGIPTRVPTLSSMIGLKIIAWAYRNETTHKDARDLGPLIQATYHGPEAERIWSESKVCEMWDYDDTLVGPYLAGRHLASNWDPSSRQRLLRALEGNSAARLE